MDALTLLTEARAAGLAVSAAGDQLVVRGPRRAEPLVRALAAQKAEVLVLLRPPAPPAPPGAPAAAAADSTADQGAACPRCRALEAEAAKVLQELADRLPVALRGLPPERLAILVKWTLVALTNPRPQWPPPPPPPRGRARPSLAGAIVALGGEAVGGSDADAAPPHDTPDDGSE